MILKLTRAYPDDRTKLRLDVDGNYRCGPPLGLTILDDRIDYSEKAPEILESSGNGKPGPKPEARNKAKTFILAELANGDRAGVDLLKKWKVDGNPERTFWDARKELIDEGKLVVDDSRKPKMWHYVAEDEAEWLKTC